MPAGTRCAAQKRRGEQCVVVHVLYSGYAVGYLRIQYIQICTYVMKHHDIAIQDEVDTRAEKGPRVSSCTLPLTIQTGWRSRQSHERRVCHGWAPERARLSARGVFAWEAKRREVDMVVQCLECPSIPCGDHMSSRSKRGRSDVGRLQPIKATCVRGFLSRASPMENDGVKSGGM